MRRDEVRRAPPPEVRRALALLRAGWDLLRLELALLTGGRALLLAGVELAWLVVIAVMAHLRDDPWDAASHYNRAVLVPGLLPALALGMAAVMGPRDDRQLEMTFASAGGRYRAWVFKLVAISAWLLTSSLVVSALTWAAVDHDYSPLAGALHATVPLVLVAVLTVFLTVLFRGGPSAALVTAAFVALSFLMFHPATMAGIAQGSVSALARFDLFLNPFAEPRGLADPDEWTRTVIFNRGLLLSGTGLLTWATLAMLQRRERLL